MLEGDNPCFGAHGRMPDIQLIDYRLLHSQRESQSSV